MILWRVERVTEGAREHIAHGTMHASQDHDDAAIEIATKVGRVLKRGLLEAQAASWVDITTPTGRRYEQRYASTSDDWFEMRTEILTALDESTASACIHRAQRLHITFTEKPS